MSLPQLTPERIEAIHAGHKVLAEFRYEPRPVEKGYAGQTCTSTSRTTPSPPSRSTSG